MYATIVKRSNARAISKNPLFTQHGWLFSILTRLNSTPSERPLDLF